MEREEIVQAYRPFIDTLLAGGFAEPETGWNAGQIAAHVATNNDAIAELAETIAAGERPSYDNAEVIDDAQLQAVASANGGVQGLAGLVETSAGRLADAWALLGPEAGAIEIPVRIADGGKIMRDGPIAIGNLIEGNATFHLQVHLRQLQSLRA
jgi:Mycothiol maleylpyruvate isomerase N-terminal domain